MNHHPENGQQPNYITEHRRFLTEALEIGLSATAQLMYIHLLDIFNERGWPRDTHISNQALAHRLGCSDESVLRARRQLLAMGRIRYQGQRRHYPRYGIIYYSLPAGENPVENLGKSRGRGGAAQAVETPVKSPAERDASPRGEQPVERAVENPVENPVEYPVEMPVEIPVEIPVEMPVEISVETPQKKTRRETQSSSSSSSAREGVHPLWGRLSDALYPPGPVEAPLVAAWARDFDPGVVEDLLELALKRDKRSYRYLEVSLSRLKARGITTWHAYQAHERAFAQARLEAHAPPGVRVEDPPARKPWRPVREVAQHRYSGQRSYTPAEWEAVFADPFALDLHCG